MGTGNSGLAADFLDLSLRKARDDGVIALVLPLSGVSGTGWEGARKVLARKCQDITVITIAGAGSYDSSFSADTGMAECLLIARRGKMLAENRATFVILHRQPRATVEAELLAAEISRIRESGQLRTIEHLDGLSTISIGEQEYGVIIDASLPQSGPWSLAGIAGRESLAKVGWYHLERGMLRTLLQVGQPGQHHLLDLPSYSNWTRLPVAWSCTHADIYWNRPGRWHSPRGPLRTDSNLRSALHPHIRCSGPTTQSANGDWSS